MSQSQEERAARWNPHQETILDLYVTQKLPLKDVMAHMEREHQFHARQVLSSSSLSQRSLNSPSSNSKADFEAQWKVWGIRKNISSAEWDFLRYRLGKRKRANKESEVCLQGELVPNKKLEKQLSQRFPPTFKGYPSPALIPQTPPGISVRTPREIDGPLDDDQHAPSDGRIVSPRNYPCVLCNVQSPTFRLDNLSWYRFQGAVDPQGSARLASGPDASFVPLNTALSEQRSLLYALFPWDFEYHRLKHPTLLSYLRTILPTKNDEEIASVALTLTPPLTADSVVLLLRIAVYLAVNNMLSPTRFYAILAWLVEKSDLPMRRASIARTIPVIRDNAIKTLCTAIKKCNVRGRIEPLAENDGERPSTTSQRDVEVVRLLLDWGADVHTQDGYNYQQDLKDPSFRETPLHLAVRSRNLDVVRLLLDYGADVNRKENHSGCGRTALQVAAELNDIEVVRTLLAKGANVNNSGYDGGALEVAVGQGNTKVVEVLLKKSRPASIQHALERAASNGSVEIVETLLEHLGEIDPSLVVSFLLERAADSVATASTMVKWALIDPKRRRERPFARRTLCQTAVASGSTALILRLMERRAIINSSNCAKPLHYCFTKNTFIEAVKRRHTDMANLIVEKGTFINSSRFGEPLCSGEKHLIETVLYHGDVDLAKFLLEKAAIINSPGLLAPIGGGEALIEAVSSGNMEMVKFLLAKTEITSWSDDVEQPCSGEVALSTALAHHRVDVFKLLLEEIAHVDPCHQLRDHTTLLPEAARIRNMDLVQLLLDKGAAVDAQDQDGFTALHIALGGHIENDDNDFEQQCCEAAIVRVLLEKEANVRAKTPGGDTPLHLAIHGSKKYWFDEPSIPLCPESIGLARLILSKPSDINALSGTQDARTALELAAYFGSVELVQLLLRAGADIHIGSPLRAAANTKVELFQLLLRAGAVMHSEPLVFPVQCGNIELVQLLLREGANVHIGLLLVSAAETGNIELVTMLIAGGADVNAVEYRMSPLHLAVPGILPLRCGVPYFMTTSAKYGTSALHRAAQDGHIEIARFLLDSGADVEGRQCTRNVSPLSLAVGEIRVEMIQLLLARGADVDAWNDAGGGVDVWDNTGRGNDWRSLRRLEPGRGPLECAAESSSVGVVKMLLEAGAKVNALPFQGYSALQIAATRGAVGIAQILLMAGARVDDPPSQMTGMTALEGAASNGRLDMVQLLLNAGAGSQCVGPGRLSESVELAKSQRHFTIVDLLKAAEADVGDCGISVKLGENKHAAACGVAKEKAEDTAR